VVKTFVRFESLTQKTLMLMKFLMEKIEFVSVELASWYMMANFSKDIAWGHNLVLD